jgi:GTP-binding protein EngB required for normal cell division
LVRNLGWKWLTRLKSNRRVSAQAGQQQAVSALDIPPSGLVMHLRGYGFAKVFRTAEPHGNPKH